MSLSKIVETVVDEKVQLGYMFTAHDITLEVRSRGHRASHGDVRDYVHDYYNRGGFGIAYTRTNISVPGGGSPYLYYRTVDDPANYKEVRGTSTTPIVNSSIVSMPSSQVVIPPSLLNGGQTNVPVNVKKSAKPGLSKSRPVDKRGTLSIPTQFIRQLFIAGQKVFAVANTDGVNIVADQPTNNTVFGKYTVDKNTQVRITQSLLHRAGIGGSEYDIEHDLNKVVVKLAK